MPTEITAQFGVGTVSCPLTITGAECIAYNEKPYSASVAELRDENGDVVKRQEYGNGDIKEHEATFELSCGTSSQTITVTLGGTNKVESVNVSTSNSAWPQIVVKWYSGFGTGQSALCDDGNSYEETITLEGKKKAQIIDLAHTGYLQSSTWSASCKMELLLDGSGVPKAFAFSDGTVQASAETIGGTITKGSMETFEATEDRSREDFVTAGGSGTRTLTKQSSS